MLYDIAISNKQVKSLKVREYMMFKSLRDCQRAQSEFKNEIFPDKLILFGKSPHSL